MDRAALPDIELEYAVRGDGEPVLLIHPGIFADWLTPLFAEPVLASHYRFVHYHRVGCAGSSHVAGPVSLSRQVYPRLEAFMQSDYRRHFTPAQLGFARRIADSGSKLESIVSTLRKDGYDVGAHEVLKTAPRGYPKDHTRIELLKHKGIVMSKSWSVGAWLGTSKAKSRVDQMLVDARAKQPLTVGSPGDQAAVAQARR